MPSPTTGTCRLCLTSQVILRHSHIISEAFYKRVYTKSHKLLPISKDPAEKVKFEQKGYREYLLCAACETKLSVWEGTLSQITSEIASDTYSTCTATRAENVVGLTKLDYRNIKMGVLSIFWRMGISSLKLFDGYNLGPYSEVLRRSLDMNILPGETEFPILISKGLLNGAFSAGVLFLVGRGRFDNNLIVQSVVLNGIVFDCIMTNSKSIPQDVIAFALSPAGRVLILSRPYEELGLNLGEFSARMKDSDIKNFFAQH